MKQVLFFYRKINVLSIDVAGGAFCAGMFFFKVMHAPVKWYELIVLSLTVWIIYTADHLLDAHRLQKNIFTVRHQFHRQYFWPLLIFLIMAVLVDVILILSLEKSILINGIFLLAGVAIYLTVQTYIPVIKELLAAILYTTGILLPVISINFNMNKISVPLVLQFFFLVLINLLVFSWFDYEQDQKQKTHSFVSVAGKKNTSICIGLIFVVVIILTIFSTQFAASLLIVGISFLLMMLLIKHRYFSQHDRFRLVGDALFYIFALYGILLNA